MPLTEQDARQVMELMPSLTPENQQKARQALGEYQAARQSAGEPLFPEWEQQQLDAEKAYRGMFADLKTVDKVAPSIVPMLEWDDQPDETRARVANTSFLSRRYGKSADEIDGEYDLYRSDYARNSWDNYDELSDTAFHALAAKEVQHEADAENLMGSLDQYMAQAAVAGEAFPRAFGDWQKWAEDKPGYEPHKSGRIMRAAEQAHRQLSNRLEPYRKVVEAAAYTALYEFNAPGIKGDAPKEIKSAEEIAELLLDVPEPDRPLVFKAIIALAKLRSGEDDATLVDKMILRIGRGASNLADNALGAIERGFIEKSEAVPDFFVDLVKGEGAASKLAAGAKREKDRMLLAEQFRRVAEGEIAPLTSGYLAGRGLLGTAEMVPMTLASLVPYVGPASMLAQFNQETYLDLRLSNPEMSDGTASAIAAFAAPLQAVSEVVSDRFLIGRLPTLARAVKAPVTTRAGAVALFGRQLALGTTVEMGEEHFQQLVPLAFQQVADALAADVPGVDWSGYLKRNFSAEFNTELLAQILPLSLIGAGFATFDNLQHSRSLALSSAGLEAAGYTPEVSAKVVEAAKQGDWEGAQNLMRQNWNAAEAAGIKPMPEAERRAVADAVAETQAMQAAKRTAIRRAENGWEVSTQEGGTVSKAVFPTHEEAFAAMQTSLASFDSQTEQTTLDALNALSAKAVAGEEFAVTDALGTLGLFQREAESRKAEAAKSGDKEAEMQAEADLQAIWNRHAVENERLRAAGRPEAGLDDLQVLGQSITHFREGVAVYSSRLFRGGGAIDLVEEKAENDVRRAIGSKRTTVGRMATLIREAEQATGDKYLHGFTDGADADADMTAVVEGYSSLARLYVTGTKKTGLASASRRGQLAESRALRQRLKASADGKLGSLLRQELDFWKAVLGQVVRLARAKKEGRLGEIEQFLRETTQLQEQEAHTAGVENEVSDWVDKSLLPDYTPPTAEQEAAAVKEGGGMAGGIDAPFSLSAIENSRAEPSSLENVTEMPDGALLVGPASFSIRAYHGTPHKVDRFSTAKIGTGEGAQAYGWGLYFAESQAVANEYRKKFTTSRAGDLVEKDAQEFLNKSGNNAKAAIKLAKNDGKLFPALERAIDRIAKSGNLYTIELLPDADEFLDWDKPLSEQSEKVKGALAAFTKNLDDATFPTGGALYSQFVTEPRGDQKASQKLASLGIPGIRYLDGGSRGAGDGTRNYVIFDESLVRILEENGRKVEQGQASFSLAPAQNASAPSPGGLNEADVIRSIGPRIAAKLVKRKTDRVAPETLSFSFEPADDPAFDGDGYFYPSWRAPTYDDKYLEKFVPLPTISISAKNDGFYVGDGVEKFSTLNEAKEAVRAGIEEYLSENSGSYNINLDGKESAREVFDEAGQFFDRFGGEWGGSKWGSWYYNTTDKDGREIKISIRDHEATRKDMGLPDKAWEVSKRWEPEEVADALAKAFEWLKANAESLAESGAAGIKPKFEVGENQSSPQTPPAVRPDFDPYGMGMSLRPFSRLVALGESLESAAIPPEARRKMQMQAAMRLKSVVADAQPLLDASRTLASLERERRFREADARQRILDDEMSKLSPATLAAFYGDAALADAREHPLIANLLVRDQRAPGGWRGRLASRTRAKGSPEYDDMPSGLPSWFFGGRQKPDVLAQEMYEEGLIVSPYADVFWREVESAFKTAWQAKADIAQARDAVKAAEKQAAAQAKAEADQWYNEARKKVESPKFAKAKLLEWMRILDAVLSPFPGELRARVGGFIRLAQLSTDEARAREVVRRVERMGVLLESHLQKELREEIGEIVERNAAQKENGISKGRLSAGKTAVFNYVRDLLAMNDAAQEAELGRLEAVIGTATDADEQAEALSKWGIASLFAGYSGQTAQQLDAALAFLKQEESGGRLARSVLDEARKAEIEADRESIKTGLSAKPVSDVDEYNWRAEHSALVRWADWFMGMVDSALLTTMQQLDAVLGQDHAFTRKTMSRLRKAHNQREDLMREIAASKREMLRRVLNTKSDLVALKKLGELQRAVKKTGVFIVQNRSAKKVRFPAEKVRQFIEGGADPAAFGLNDAAAEDLASQWADDPEKSSYEVEIVESAGNEQEIGMSRMEALQFLMSWNQPGIRESMEANGWSEDSAAQLRAFAGEEGVAIMDWMRSWYDRGYDIVNAVHERVHHAPLPRNENYSPVYRKTANTDHVTDLEMRQMGSGLAAGFVKGRVRNNLPLHKIDAITAFLSHWEQVAHWSAYAEIVRDIRAVLLDRQVSNTIKVKRGPSAMSNLQSRVSALEDKGTSAAFDLHQLNTFWHRLNQYRAFKGLAFRLSPIIKQAPAILNPMLYDVPADAYAAGLARLMAGQLELGEAWNSPTIQRRLMNGFSPEARIAMSAAGANASVLIALMQKGMVPMQWTDAAWNTAGAAIAFDYYLRQARRAGANEAEARNRAADRMDDMIQQAAQPNDLANRSLVENFRSPFVKSLWMFASESRKTLAIEYVAARRLLTGKSKNVTADVRRIAVAHLAQGAVTQLMASFYALLLGDDDDRERAWSEEAWLAALEAGPINGLFVAGGMVEMAIRRFNGLPWFRSEQPIVRAANDAISGAANLDDLFGDDEEKLWKEIDRLSSATAAILSATVSPAAGAPDVLANAVREAAKAAD